MSTRFGLGTGCDIHLPFLELVHTINMSVNELSNSE
jgi:hypothetical protein